MDGNRVWGAAFPAPGLTPTVSPCTGLCKLDEATGWCRGCGRDGAELLNWASESPAWRGARWAELPTRLTKLGAKSWRLPWDAAAIAGFATETLRRGGGRWSLGVPGALALLPQMQDVTLDGAVLSARAGGDRLRLTINDDIRAIGIDRPDTPLARTRILLAVKRECRRLPVARTLSPLEKEGEGCFDLGLGLKELRVLLRGAELSDLRGQVWAEAMPALRRRPLRWTLQTRLGTYETDGAGAAQWLTPDTLAQGRVLPEGGQMPRAYAPGALFVPAP